MGLILMPTNVTAEYAAAELKFQKAKTVEEKIAALKEMLATVPKHKGTENLVKELKKRLARLKSKAEKQSVAKKHERFSVSKTGDALIVLTGFTNTGKSLLLSKLTNAKPRIQDYAFTTEDLEIGIFDLEGAKLQVVELPALLGDYSNRDKQLLSVVRNADLLLIIAKTLQEAFQLLQYLEKNNFRFRPKPEIIVKKTGKPGIVVSGLTTGLNIELVKTIASQYLTSGEIIFKQQINNDVETLKTCLEDALNNSLKFSKAIILINNFSQQFSELKHLQLQAIGKAFPNIKVLEANLKEISSQALNELKQEMFKLLNLIRVKVKPSKHSQEIVKTLHKNAKLQDLAEMLGKVFVKNFKFARLFGTNTDFQGKRISLNHELLDGDVIEFHLR
ncbi:50S ribosome-binding GTPase [Candidatus Woesearchaeota archaeon]|nr:50S ribosome-binding GTPase [Candidatus Woesearchaeota archaeon]